MSTVNQRWFWSFSNQKSSLGYKWNVPISYIDKDGNYKLEWMLTNEQFELKGRLGADFWLDPESHAFVRTKYGSFLELGWFTIFGPFKLC